MNAPFFPNFEKKTSISFRKSPNFFSKNPDFCPYLRNFAILVAFYGNFAIICS